jgi:hypothetical protein
VTAQRKSYYPERGLWFDGQQYLSVKQFALSHTPTLELWVNPWHSDEIFFTAQTPETVLLSWRARNDCMEVEIDSQVLTDTDTAYHTRHWTHLALTLSSDPRATDSFLTLYTNGSPLFTATVTGHLFDTKQALHLIGSDLMTYFTGFLFEFGIAVRARM